MLGSSAAGGPRRPSISPRRRLRASPAPLACALLLAASFGPAAAAPEQPPAPASAAKPDPTRKPEFGLSQVEAIARRLAEQPWQKPVDDVPEWLVKINYDQWRDIRFRPEASLWRPEAPKDPKAKPKERPSFEAQFFHPGLFYTHTVKINEVDGGKVEPVAFSPSQFDYGKTDIGSRVPQNLGYAGFRLHYPIKTKDYLDEVIVFLGATYFRAVGRDQAFGLSARGLAVDTAEPRGEEFPTFTEFWLVKPAPKAAEMTIYALLDSPSIAGAYRFVVAPGEQTAVSVEMRLFLRQQVKKLGIGPLTSMYFHGENTNRWFDDFRPEVHDSDGLLVHFRTGEWLWRPLDNPRGLRVSSQVTSGPLGFGLVQRDRDFASYQDLETHQETRPSAWIEPLGDWGAGRVELVEIPTEADANDNVVAFWVPDRQYVPAEPISFAYTLSWYGDDPTRSPAGRVISTRNDSMPKSDTHRFVIDFAGKNLTAIPPDQVLRGMLTVQGGPDVGEIVEQHVVKNAETGGWRLVFQLRPRKREVDLRAYLEKSGETLTETWSYLYAP